MNIRFKACLLSISLLSTGQGHGLDIDDATSPLNDRFTNDASFIMDDYDLSGVGRTGGGKWGTLVSNNVFVSAFHFAPNPGGLMTFYQTNDPSGPSVTIEVASGQRIGSSDIFVGVLTEPVPVGYAFYSFATADINDTIDYAASVYNNQDAFMIGQSPFNDFSGTQDVAAGRNVLDSWIDSFSAAGTTDDAIRAEIETELLDVLYESTLVSGDSGAPLFVDFNEADTNFDLQLVGTNWFVQSSSGTPVQNGFTYLGNYDAQIQAIIDENFVPEPSAFALFGMATAILVMRRRRSS